MERPLLLCPSTPRASDAAEAGSAAAAAAQNGDKVRLVQLKGEGDNSKAPAHGGFDHMAQAAPFRRLRRRCGRLDRLQVGQVVGGLGKDVDVLVKAFLLRAQSRVHGLVC